MRKRTTGFTLIELVAVIAMVSIVSAFALPRVSGLSRDARVAALEGLEASFKIAAEQAIAKARIVGAANQARSSSSNPPLIIWDTNGDYVEAKYGYPEARAEGNTALGILDLVELSPEWEVCYSANCTTGNSSRVKVGYDTSEGSGCYVRYSEPGGTGAPSDTHYGTLVVTQSC